MAEPAEDDVERLAEWAHLPGVTSVSEDRQVALNLLRRGVTLPPEPDTPAEPQERFYVEASVDAIPHPRWWVLDRADERNPIRTDAPEDAYLVASLLNLDAKYEGGIEAEIERMRDKASARAVKALQVGSTTYTIEPQSTGSVVVTAHPSLDPRADALPLTIITDRAVAGAIILRPG